MNKKIVLIIRHAKSSWDSTTRSDFERPLNDRGIKDAPVMAKRLLERQINIDAFIASPAKRAKQTAEFFVETFNHNKNEIIFIEKLYHAPSGIFYEVINDINNTINTVAIFSHNPGITEFVNSITNNVTIDNMPTCGVFAVSAVIETWRQFQLAEKQFLFFDYPKKI